MHLTDRGGGRRQRVEVGERVPPVRPELAAEHGVHPRRRHRRGGVLQPGQVRPVRRRDVLGQHRLEQAEGLAELHRAALELAQHPEQLLGRPLLHLLAHLLGRRAAQPLAQTRAWPGRRSRAAARPAGPRAGRPNGRGSRARRSAPGPLRARCVGHDAHSGAAGPTASAAGMSRPGAQFGHESATPTSSRVAPAVSGCYRPRKAAPGRWRPSAAQPASTCGQSSLSRLSWASTSGQCGSASRRARSAHRRHDVRPGRTSGPTQAASPSERTRDAADRRGPGGR